MQRSVGKAGQVELLEGIRRTDSTRGRGGFRGLIHAAFFFAGRFAGSVASVSRANKGEMAAS